MSNRTLIEINHDFLREIDSEPFRDALRRYINSADRLTADELTNFGVKVVGMRHHSGNFVLDGEPDGFPVRYLPRSPA